MTEILYVDDGATAVLVTGTSDDGHPVVVKLGTPFEVKPDENGSYDLAGAHNPKAAKPKSETSSSSSTPAKPKSKPAARKPAAKPNA